MPKPKTKKKIAKDSSSGGHLGDISDQSLRRTKAAVDSYRKMIQEDAGEIGAFLLEWARRQDKTGSPTSLLEQVFARAKKAEYPQKTFYRDGKLIHELVAAFLFELKIRSDWIGPDLFERANLELPMVRQRDYINNIKEPRSRDSAKSGGIEYFSSMSRTNRQRTNQLNKAAKFMPNPYLNEQIQAILRKSLSK